jgi:hypothetical protein
MCVRACVQYKAGLAGRKWTAGDEVTLFCVGKMADRRRRWSTGRASVETIQAGVVE